MSSESARFPLKPWPDSKHLSTSSEKFLFVAFGDLDWDPHVISMRRVREVLVLNRVCVLHPLPWDLRIIMEEGSERLRDPGVKVCSEAVFPDMIILLHKQTPSNWHCLHKIWTKWSQSNPRKDRVWNLKDYCQLMTTGKEIARISEMILMLLSMALHPCHTGRTQWN